MIIRQTKQFKNWIRRLRDSRARSRILARWSRIGVLGITVGDIKPVGDGVYEMRFDFGPGYRVYFSYENSEIILLLAGGDKSSQPKDIRQAQSIKKEATDQYGQR